MQSGLSKVKSATLEFIWSMSWLPGNTWHEISVYHQYSFVMQPASITFQRFSACFPSLQKGDSMKTLCRCILQLNAEAAWLWSNTCAWCRGELHYVNPDGFCEIHVMLIYVFHVLCTCSLRSWLVIWWQTWKVESNCFRMSWEWQQAVKSWVHGFS